jgi:putative transposase
MQRFGCSQRNALRVVQMSASTYLYRSVARDATALRLRIKEITQRRVHFGYRRVYVMLRREGHMDNVKRVYRLYREEGLSLRLKRPRRNKAAKLRQPKQLALAINEIWSMEFVARSSTAGSCACSPSWTASRGSAWPSMLAKV